MTRHPGSPRVLPGGGGEPPLCDICGARMRYTAQCKIVCPRCGYTRDCSDPAAPSAPAG